MTSLKSDFLRIVTERGYMHQCTDLEALDKRLTEGCQAAYIGFDCTATSLHVGGLMQIMLLRWWQKTGHKPIVLMGGGTTRIGDPTGKDESRKMLTDEVIATNMAGIKTVFTKYLTFGDGQTDALMVNNADWLDKLNYIDFLRDYGHHFTINRMLTFDSVKLRLEREQPLTFLEFNYMLLQGYDFVELYRRNKCILQMGGSDQWGNIINGVELGRRADQAELFGLTSPLLTTSSGAKMGKTVNGAVWLNDDMLSAWEFWQYWRNTEDADVGRFLKLYTELPLDEIARLEKLEGAEINEAKKILANEVTRLCHGEAAAIQAAETARKTFEEGMAATDLPTIEIPAAELAAGIPAFALFVRAGLAASNGEARRLLKGGGGKVNDQAVDEARPVGSADLKDGAVKLTAGKKRHILVKAV
ncbi:Tyrosyl-tRNA synthetase [Paramagnetospirillum magnetotacticum MS-1]|uniref:Tyrosine--tRNA ligase n=1 Tax=Paramagnetospirillum magnetotacticum MS-1 TaxID=272627 RepID=A0A0C2UF66_PARME|nr:tyrosine--tRNA ligase [Paramagnetospirillum magnetotacticum]KIM00128.1 Tyrosyl-tRNA synthetase [Paramagnetospirillum magnetotacticum MS-1]